MKYSIYQDAVFEEIKHGSGNLVIDAVAGGAKTTTIIKSLDFINPCMQVLFLAFNRHIAEELKKRVPPNVTASTFNAYGWALCRGHFGFIKLNENKTKNILLYDILKLDDLSHQDKFKAYKFIKPVCRLVSLFKAHDLYTDEAKAEASRLMDKYDINEPEPLNGQDVISVAVDTYCAAMEKTRVMDFDDQIIMPIRHDLIKPAFDFIFVDEAQDLNPVQINFVKLLGKNGRVICVGDTYQAIYGFRGADPEAISTIVEKLGAKTLPLSICYRCPKSVVKEAQLIVPHIEYSEQAADGSVSQINEADFENLIKSDDYALCRTTAPLVTWCLKFIRKGRKATVKGRDIGESLIELINSLGTPDTPTDSFIENLLRFKEEQCDRLKKLGREAEIVSIEDRCDTLLCLLETAPTLKEVISKIESIFKDDVSGVVFCTVHKAKGLETKNVFILKPELMPHPKCTQEWQQKQEANLKYVAITRAQENLYWVLEKGASVRGDSSISVPSSESVAQHRGDDQPENPVPVKEQPSDKGTLESEKMVASNQATVKRTVENPPAPVSNDVDLFEALGAIGAVEVANNPVPGSRAFILPNSKEQWLDQVIKHDKLGDFLDTDLGIPFSEAPKDSPTEPCGSGEKSVTDSTAPAEPLDTLPPEIAKLAKGYLK